MGFDPDTLDVRDAVTHASLEEARSVATELARAELADNGVYTERDPYDPAEPVTDADGNRLDERLESVACDVAENLAEGGVEADAGVVAEEILARARQDVLRAAEADMDRARREGADFAMFSAEGNRAVARAVAPICTRLASGELADVDRAWEHTCRTLDAVAENNDGRFSEASDTAVRDEAARHVYHAAARAGREPDAASSDYFYSAPEPPAVHVLDGPHAPETASPLGRPHVGPAL